MLGLASTQKVYLACGSTDMRKSIDSLAAIVQQSFALDPFSSALFVFCNKSRDKIKILQWDHNGFWLYYKRLEKGKFDWLKEGAGTAKISVRKLRWLLDGLSLKQRSAHKKVIVNTVI
ncbi:IS66 family insertion sequence element accessory protein TnpB [Caldicoprobacter guelmensis]|uniref:IS66 family insertion sequence element accessory protein TnpB n=1 Tax=Caldicoprobacter guelmensis TaxID=1170224 RepID=UPI002434CA83|nr:IS66 family insertion sequence element accessory protein TnpB [Caldicoprobacter guelmensis]